jgi:hypothetical protein
MPATISLMATKYTYSFKSEVGTFWIRQERDKSWSLSIGEEIIEEIRYFSSAFEAADSVFMQTFGWDEWDTRMQHDAPATLSGWRRKLVR